jgi:hypothetical protein
MEPEVDSVGIAILKGACNAESKDVAIDLSQFGLVELLGETALKEIPVIKGVVACFKVPLAIRDQLFLRKVARFLAAVPDFTATEREDFIAGHLADGEKAAKLGETLVLVLDRLDDMEKPHMVAHVFAAFVRGKITFDVFRRLATAIDLGALDDLKEFVKMRPAASPQQRGVNVNTQILGTNLARTGLVSLPAFGGNTPILGVSFRENELGKMFREIINEAQPSSA